MRASLPFVLMMALAGVPRGAAAEGAEAVLQASGVRGGLLVHVGCGNGHLTAELAAEPAFLVQGLAVDPDQVSRARQHLRQRGLYGRATAVRFDGAHLPYIDGCVNLLVADDPHKVPVEEMVRVLCPGGVALIAASRDLDADVATRPGAVEAGAWTRIARPWPADIDEWTHYLHAPDNNAVSRDRRVAAPYHAQWIAAPKWARHHNHLSSTSALVTSGGRLFAVLDEGPIASLAQPPQWRLVARDAFSGVVLWKREVAPWEGILRPFRSGPSELNRRLVAAGDRIYATLGYRQPLVALDAATGETVRTYADTEDTVEVLLDGEVLYLVGGDIAEGPYAESRRRGAASPPPRNKRISAIEAATGKRLWERSDAETSELLPSTLAVSGGKVFFQGPLHLVCLDAADGNVRWKADRPVSVNRLSWSVPTLVVHEDVVLSADCAVAGGGRAGNGGGAHGDAQVQWKVTARPENGAASQGELIAFSATDGRELWRCPTAQGYNAAADVFVADGLVWASYAPGRNTPDLAEGRDLRTGEVQRRLDTAGAFTETHHHRCYRNKATDRFLLLGRTGIELIDLDRNATERHCWVRGACQYGVMPANGLLYVPPHACACYIQSKLSGFWALAPKRPGPAPEATGPGKAPRLERGPAFGAGSEKEMSAAADAPSNDWPTFRHDAARSGCTAAAVPAKLAPAWETELGGRLTAPVVARGVLLVAAVDQHTVHALGASDGKPAWEYTTGGRIDSPPTIHGELAIFGSADGCVYCLRLHDGRLVWRFRAAPVDRRLVAFGQVESVWPVTGSVLVRDGVVYCTAGRSSYLDGGMTLYRLDAATGALLGQTRFDSRDPQTGHQPEELIEDTELPGALPDVLVCDGRFIYLRDLVLSLDGVDQKTFRPHLYCSAGLLDDTWWHRTYWQWAERAWGRASGWAVMARIRPSGRLLVADEKTVFGYGRKNVSRSRSLADCHLFRADKKVETIDKAIRNNNAALMRLQKPAKVNVHWSREVPLVVRAMVLAGDVLWAAGPGYDGSGEEPALGAAGPAVLAAYEAESGERIAGLDLDSPPVFDGMAAAGDRLFLSSVDHKVVCLEGTP